MIRRLGWITDPHFDRTTVAGVTRLAEAVAEQAPDALLVTGDVAVGPSLRGWLRTLRRVAGVPVYFVLGNHDAWGLDIRAARQVAREAAEGLEGLHYLTDGGPVALTEDTALVGHDGWYDGRAGAWETSRLRMRDWKRIADFAEVEGQAARVGVMRSLADAAAAALVPALEAAAATHPTVLVATHVPPWREAGRHRGAPLDDHLAPWYVSRAMGKAIAGVAALHPGVTFRVLAGHTHARCAGVRIAPNLTCDVGGARYGRPALEAVLDC